MPFTPAITDKFTKVGTPGTATTLAAPGFTSGVTTSINVGSTTNWPTDTLVRFGIDVATIVNGLEVRTAGTYNEFSGIVTSGTTIGSLTREYGTAQNYVASSLTRVYIPVAATRENALIDGLGQDHNLKGNHKTLTDDNGLTWLERGFVASAVNQIKVTNAITGTPPRVEANGTDTNINLLEQGKGSGNVVSKLAAQQGYLMNGQISRTVATNNLTVAIKTLFGNDPSVNDPVFVRIGNTVRSITAALSITLNAGTNWFSKGAGYFATTETDFFVYLVWNTNQTAVQIAFSSDPGMRIYSDFSTTNTNWNYFGGTGTAPAATDEAEVIGRFNATLSATAAFNWSVPATSIIINRPIFETRIFTYTNSGGGGGALYFKQVNSEKRCWGSTNNSGAIATNGVAALVVNYPITYTTPPIVTTLSAFVTGDNRLGINVLTNTTTVLTLQGVSFAAGAGATTAAYWHAVGF